MSACLTRMPETAIANVKPDLRNAARAARCRKHHGHTTLHEAPIQVQNGPNLVLVTLRWPKHQPRKTS